MKTIHLMVGIQGSGKTTLAKKLSSALVAKIVSTDEVRKTFPMIDENGNEIVYDVLFTFGREETHKNYIVYTDNTKDAEGNVEVYASIYDPNDPHSKLEAIETDKEWKVIETILETLQEEVRKQANNNQDNEQ